MLDSANEIDRVNELMLQTCKKHGVPPYSPRLLEAIKNMLIPKKLARIFVARLAGKMVAAVVLFIMNNDSIYAYNFSDSNYLRFRPNNALIWAAIKWSLDNALSNLDLGISSPQDNELLSFKMRWGATRTRVRDYFLVRGGMAIPADRRASLRYRLAAAAWRTLLPSFLARKMGPMLLTHLE
jgi:lipid II:glycine glycyltransferase (peptidoglycan interpeptide bridge formation enzyme)